ncbi:MAG TPA: DUF5682 family protein [Streptosporangiaceae bacterium]|nr:DUF5682 family protein [Streptosporangiaceae bacterium]
MSVSILGIRHHGPGSARSVEQALTELKPDAVLVEGPPEAEPLLTLAAHPDMHPPVALLGYASDEPRRAAFYPFTCFSPEWQAIRYALTERVALRMIDLPLAHVLAARPDRAIPAGEPPASVSPAGVSPAGEPPAGEPAGPDSSRPAADPDMIRSDPIAWLAEAAGHGDPERFWEDVVEHRGGEQAFAAITDAMAALREAAGPDGNTPLAGRGHEARREAQMRQAIRRATREGHERVAVICGAWHAPALARRGPASADAALLKGLTRRKVTLTWVPWTYDRLSYRSGYGAGITSPGWYDHLYRHHGGQVLVLWLAKTARLLREEDIGISSAHVIEAVRLAEALAALRGRPLAGLPELTDATRAVLGEGADTALALVHERLVVGQVLGSVPAEAPTVPLQAELEREQRRLRMRPEAGARDLDLDLRRPLDRDRSRLLHRLTLLGIGWGEAREASGARGTFHEIWHLQWQPEYAVSLVEASRYGSTLAEAATALVSERLRAEPPLATLTELVGTALLADLPDAVGAAMAAFERRAAVAADAAQLMDALPPLARVLRYGNVRETDVSQVADIVVGLVARIVVGLPLAVSALDDDAAAGLAGRIDRVDAAVGLLERDELRAGWRGALASLAGRTDVHGRVTGRCTRILHDAGLLEPAELGRRMSLTLSPGHDPAAGAAWIEGFLGRSGLVLLHDETLLRLIDGWLSGVRGDAFTQILPVLRRTFSTFPAGERRQIGEHVRRFGGGSSHNGPGPGGTGTASADAPGEALDPERTAVVLPVLRLILGAGGPQ